MFGFFKKKEKNDFVTTSILPRSITESSELELRDILAPSALKVNTKELNLGEKVVRSFFVISYPRFLSEDWFSPVINMDKMFDISIFIHPLETAKILRSFQKKVAEVQSQIRMREEKGLVRDPMLDTAYGDLENLRDQLMQAQEKMFEMGLYISIYAGNRLKYKDPFQTSFLGPASTGRADFPGLHTRCQAWGLSPTPSLLSF